MGGVTAQTIRQIRIKNAFINICSFAEPEAEKHSNIDFVIGWFIFGLVWFLIANNSNKQKKIGGKSTAEN